MAYEILINMLSEGDEVSYNYKSDLWSIGVIYYQMLQGDLPFSGHSTQALIQNIKENYDKLQYEEDVSQESRDLINSLLQIDPEKRIDWNGVMNHALFKSKEVNQEEGKETEKKTEELL